MPRTSPPTTPPATPPVPVEDRAPVEGSNTTSSPRWLDRAATTVLEATCLAARPVMGFVVKPATKLTARVVSPVAGPAFRCVAAVAQPVMTPFTRAIGTVATRDQLPSNEGAAEIIRELGNTIAQPLVAGRAPNASHVGGYFANHIVQTAIASGEMRNQAGRVGEVAFESMKNMTGVTSETLMMSAAATAQVGAHFFSDAVRDRVVNDLEPFALSEGGETLLDLGAQRLGVEAPHLESFIQQGLRRVVQDPAAAVREVNSVLERDDAASIGRGFIIMACLSSLKNSISVPSITGIQKSTIALVILSALLGTSLGFVTGSISIGLIGGSTFLVLGLISKAILSLHNDYENALQAQEQLRSGLTSGSIIGGSE